MYGEKRVKARVNAFMATMRERGARCLRFRQDGITLVVVIDDRSPDKIAVTGYMPYPEETKLGHVFATSTGDKFGITDVSLEPECCGTAVLPRLMEITIATIERFNPSLIDGRFRMTFSQRDYASLTRVLYMYNFSVRRFDDWVFISKEYPAKKSKILKNPR